MKKLFWLMGPLIAGAGIVLGSAEKAPSKDKNIIDVTCVRKTSTGWEKVSVSVTYGDCTQSMRDMLVTDELDRVKIKPEKEADFIEQVKKVFFGADADKIRVRAGVIFMVPADLSLTGKLKTGVWEQVADFEARLFSFYDGGPLTEELIEAFIKGISEEPDPIPEDLYVVRKAPSGIWEVLSRSGQDERLLPFKDFARRILECSRNAVGPSQFERCQKHPLGIEMVYADDIVFAPGAEQVFPGARWMPVKTVELQKKIDDAYKELGEDDRKKMEQLETAILMRTFAQVLKTLV